VYKVNVQLSRSMSIFGVHFRAVLQGQHELRRREQIGDALTSLTMCAFKSTSLPNTTNFFSKQICSVQG
jgi:hypothetical protein